MGKGQEEQQAPRPAKQDIGVQDGMAGEELAKTIAGKAFLEIDLVPAGQSTMLSPSHPKMSLSYGSHNPACFMACLRERPDSSSCRPESLTLFLQKALGSGIIPCGSLT